MSSRMRQKEAAYTQDEIDKDQYFSKNALGQIECRLCSTQHKSEASYKAHAQGKRHKVNLERRNEGSAKAATPMIAAKKVAVVKSLKHGRPGYRVKKKTDPSTGRRTLTFEVHYPEIQEGLVPQYRIMSAFEQKREVPDAKYQYLLFAGEPYETIAFKIPSHEIQQDDTFFTTWDSDKHLFTLELCFKIERPQQ